MLSIYQFSSSQYINEMIGELFIAHDMPEPPKESFLKGLFGGGVRSLDREELCKLADHLEIGLSLLAYTILLHTHRFLFYSSVSN